MSRLPFLLLGLSACALNADRYADRYAEAYCAQQVVCVDGTDLQTCLVDHATTGAAPADACDFDLDAAMDCLDAEWSCDEDADPENVIPAADCAAVWDCPSDD